jgi:iron uptake system EfeUOB component EfeO/EfeM
MLECLLNFIKIEHELWTFNKFHNLNKVQENRAKQRHHKSFHSYIKITQYSLNTLISKFKKLGKDLPNWVSILPLDT